MTIEPKLQELIKRFNDKVESDEKIRGELKGVDRKVLIDLERKHTISTCTTRGSTTSRQAASMIRTSPSCPTRRPWMASYLER